MFLFEFFVALVLSLNGQLDPVQAIFPEREWSTAHCISYYETRGQADPNAAIGIYGERGRFQIHPIHASRFTAHGWVFEVDAHDPWKNTVIAYEIWQDNLGWTPWSTKGFCVG